MDKIIDQEFYENKTEKQNNQSEYSITMRKLLLDIETKQKNAEATRISSTDDYGNTISTGIETIWQDEHKMYIGNQWKTSQAYRKNKSSKKRPDSVNNFIFNSIQNIVSNITSSTPDIKIDSIDDTQEQEQQQEIQQSIQQQPNNLIKPDNMADIQPYKYDISKSKMAEKITCMSQFNNIRNKFSAMWKNIVLDFVKHGPIIAMVIWDNDWLGGRGPEKWIGDVRIIHVAKEEFYPDPAIINLEYRLQECSFINRKFRKKLSYIKNRWDNGKYVAEEDNERDIYQDEGKEHEQTWLTEHWHRGRPRYIPEKRKNELLELAEKYKTIDKYKSQEYHDMAEGRIEGIHLAYIANGVFLEYIPYIYDHGKYPFVFKTRYIDSDNQFGFGEIRNIMTPQILHNKADEIEIDAFSRQGLGQEYFQEGAATPQQIDEIVSKSGVGGMIFKVNDVNKIRERQPVSVPASLVNYKEHKQRMIETISNVTPIQQGMSPGSNVPFAAIRELGARTDVRLKSATEILEDFLKEIEILRIELFAQFYTHDRYYRIKSEDGKIKTGNFNNEMMMLQWERNGELEIFIPEFEVSVKILDEKPTDRNYYTQAAFELQNRQIYLPEHVLYTFEEGKFPPKEKVLSDIKANQQAAQEANMQKMQLESQQIQHKMKMEEEKLNLEKMKIIQDGQQKQVDNTFKIKENQQNMQENNIDMQQQQPEKLDTKEQGQQKDYDGFIQQLEQNFPEIMEVLGRLPEQEQSKIIENLMDLDGEELQQALLVLSQTLQSLKGDKQENVQN